MGVFEELSNTDTYDSLGFLFHCMQMIPESLTPDTENEPPYSIPPTPTDLPPFLNNSSLGCCWMRVYHKG